MIKRSVFKLLILICLFSYLIYYTTTINRYLGDVNIVTNINQMTFKTSNIFVYLLNSSSNKTNILENIKLVNRFLPDWSCVFISNNVQFDYLPLDNKLIYGEKTVDLFLHNFNVNRIAFRQIDSLLTMREVYAIKQWIHSGKIFHIIRDHPDHSETPIVYDFWGVHGTGITKLKQIYKSPAASSFSLWDLTKSMGMLQHDSVGCLNYKKTSSWPINSINGEYVGNSDSVFIKEKPECRSSLDNYLNPIGFKIIISIVACTRIVNETMDIKETHLFKTLIQSIGHTITDDEWSRYEIRLYVGYDDDDEYWINNSHKLQNEWNEQFKNDLQIIMIKCKRIPNTIPWNIVAERAILDGSEYILRLNDDSKLVSSKWITMAITTLYQMNNFGVVGPPSKEGNTAILTHDFTHKTHFNIFGYYYPPVFKNWFLDDWITYVYGDKMKKIEQWKLTHMLQQMHYVSYTPRKQIYDNILIDTKKILKKYEVKYILSPN